MKKKIRSKNHVREKRKGEGRERREGGRVGAHIPS